MGRGPLRRVIAALLLLLLLVVPHWSAAKRPSTAMLEERVGTLGPATKGYVDSQRARPDLQSALKSVPGVAVTPAAAELILIEALAAEWHYASTRHDDPDALEVVHQRTSAAVVAYLRDLANESDKKPRFASYLAVEWGAGALAAPHRNVYGYLKVAVNPVSPQADVSVDRQFVGSSNDRIVLVEGSHLVTTERAGARKSCQSNVSIRGGRTETVRCDLR